MLCRQDVLGLYSGGLAKPSQDVGLVATTAPVTLPHTYCTADCMLISAGS